MNQTGQYETTDKRGCTQMEGKGSKGKFFSVWFCVLALAACASDPQVKQAPVASLSVDWVVDADQRAPLSPPATSRPTWMKGKIVVGGRDGRVRTFNMQGSELSRMAFASSFESGALALHEHLVVFSDVRGKLYGVDLEAGKTLWTYQLSTIMSGHPVKFGQGFLVQSADNRIYRFSKDGKKLWSYAGLTGGLTMHHGASPYVYGDMIYAVFSNGDVVAVRADTGGLIWRRQLILDTGAAVLSEMKTAIADPVLAGKTLIVPIYQGNLVALATKDGEQVWSRHLSLRSSPVVSGSRIYVATSDGAMLALDAENGGTFWKKKLSDQELAGPVMWKNQLIVGDAHGQVYALNKQGGLTGKLHLSGRLDSAPVPTPRGVLLHTSLGGLYLVH